MINSWLTLKDLQYVTTVAKHLHFGRAAKECHISQPSLSLQIKKIEYYLGVVLFERTNRRVTITAAGKKMADQALIILDEAQKIPSLLAETSSAKFETLNLGVISSLMPFIPQAIASIKKVFPQTTLSLIEGTTESLVKELKTGALDVVIAADTVDERSIKAFQLFFEPFVLAAPKGHVILKRTEIRPADLNASEMVLLDEGHCLRDQALDICPANRRGNPQPFHANSLETLLHLVASGAGYTLMPLLASQQRPMKNLISYLNFKNSTIGRDVVLLCRQHSASLSNYQILLKALLGAKQS